MALSDPNKLAIPAKKLVGKAHTGQEIGELSETIGSNIQIDNTTIFVDQIPSSLPAEPNLGDVVGGVVQYVEFIVEPIAGTDPVVTGKFQGYTLKLPNNYSQPFSEYNTHPKVGTTPFTDGFVLGNSFGKLQIVPPKYSNEIPNRYVPKLFGGVTEIPLLDEIDWRLDPYAGVLFVQDVQVGLVPTTLRAWLYIGNYLSDLVGGGGPGGETNLTVTNLTASNIETTSLTASYISASYLTASTALINTLEVTNNLSASYLTASMAVIDNLEVTNNLSASYLTASMAVIDNLEVTNNLSASSIDLGNYDSLFKPTSTSNIAVWRNNPGQNPYWGVITEDMIVKLMTFTSFSITANSSLEIDQISTTSFSATTKYEVPTSAILTNNRNTNSINFSSSFPALNGNSESTANFTDTNNAYSSNNATYYDSMQFTLTVDSELLSQPLTRTAVRVWKRYLRWGASVSNNAIQNEANITTDALTQSSFSLVANEGEVKSIAKTFTTFASPHYIYVMYPEFFYANPVGIRSNTNNANYTIAGGEVTKTVVTNVRTINTLTRPINYVVLRLNNTVLSSQNWVIL